VKTVGIRELKENLSQYLRSVKAGERILVTERKKEVAMIIPCEALRQETDLFALVERGMASWKGGRPLGMSPRAVSQTGEASQVVVADRR
jgi:prevent-host-death family protein